MIAIGSDHGGYKLKEEIKRYLDENDIEYIDCGCENENPVDYPDIATVVAEKVQSTECDRGILICRSGVGMDITANKFKGIRCANCESEEKARLSRMHNNSNVLALGADYMSVSEAVSIIRVWIATDFEAGRHGDRVKIIEEIEAKNMK